MILKKRLDSLGFIGNNKIMKNEAVVLPPLTLKVMSRVIGQFINPSVTYGKRGQAVVREGKVLFGNSDYVTELCGKVV